MYLLMADTERTHSEQAVSVAQPEKPFRAVRTGARKIVRQLLALLGLFLILIGVPIAIMTPFPFVPIGLPIVILGVILLGRFSIWGHNWMERVMARHPRIERMAPNWVLQLVFGRDKNPDLVK